MEVTAGEMFLYIYSERAQLFFVLFHLFFTLCGLAIQLLNKHTDVFLLLNACP